MTNGTGAGDGTARRTLTRADRARLARLAAARARTAAAAWDAAAVAWDAAAAAYPARRWDATAALQADAARRLTVDVADVADVAAPDTPPPDGKPPAWPAPDANVT